MDLNQKEDQKHMAKRSVVGRNKRRRTLSTRLWKKRVELRKKSINPKLSTEERFDAQLKLQKMARNTSPCRVVNRCYVTGRPRGYIRKFGLSRIVFREQASRGLIPGVIKASW